jgi:hypothetical protein
MMHNPRPVPIGGRNQSMQKLMNNGKKSASACMQLVCACGNRTFNKTVSPRNRVNLSIVFGCNPMTVLSSLRASSTTSLLGDFLRSRIAVEKSFFAPPSFFTGDLRAPRPITWVLL